MPNVLFLKLEFLKNQCKNIIFFYMHSMFNETLNFTLFLNWRQFLNSQIIFLKYVQVIIVRKNKDQYLILFVEISQKKTMRQFFFYDRFHLENIIIVKIQTLQKKTVQKLYEVRSEPFFEYKFYRRFRISNNTRRPFSF